MGKKRGAGLRLVHPAGAVHASTRFIVAASTHTHPTGAMVRAACYDTPNLQAAAIQYLRWKRFAFEICKAVQIRRSPLKASSCRVPRGKRRLLAYRRPRSGKAMASRRTQHQRFDGKKGGNGLRVYLKTPNAPGQRIFSRCAAPFFLEIRQYSCEKMSCSAQKFLAAGHIGSFQIHPRG